MKLLISLVLATAIPAHAKIDSRLTWSKAKAAYNSAIVPAAQFYAGDWVFVGYAHTSDSAYHPGGKRMSGETEYNVILRIRDLGAGKMTQSDLVYTPLNKSESDVSPEKRSVWSPATGLRWKFSDLGHQRGAIVCETFKECRISIEGNTLICATLVTRERYCLEAFGRGPARYTMYIRRFDGGGAVPQVDPN